MQQKELKVFLDLAQSLSFTRAAEANNMTASTLSRLIQRLELEVGAALFVRSKRMVELTHAGLCFQQYAQESVQQWQAFYEQLHQQDAEVSGCLRVYSSVTASYSILMRLLPVLRDAHPQIEVQLSTGDQAVAIPNILADKADLAVAVEPEQQRTELAFLPLTQVGLNLIVPKMVSEPRELALKGKWQQLPFVLPQQGVSRDALLRWQQQRGIKSPIYGQVAGHEAVISLVALGFGAALVPDLVIEHSPLKHHIEIVPEDGLQQKFKVGLCCRQARRDQPVLSAVWELAAVLAF